MKRSTTMGRAATPKPKRCSKTKGGCGGTFTPVRPLQSACCVQCAMGMARLVADKKARAAQAEDRRATRARLETLKGLPELLAEAQREFNRYIRLRDHGRPCVCCGQPLGEGWLGGGYDAGHYRSVGSAPHLRFDERNCHAQRKKCNQYQAGNHVAYRAGLISRIGLAEVEALEADQEPRRYTRDDARVIKAKYRALANAMQKVAEERRMVVDALCA